MQIKARIFFVSKLYFLCEQCLVTRLKQIVIIHSIAVWQYVGIQRNNWLVFWEKSIHKCNCGHYMAHNWHHAEKIVFFLSTPFNTPLWVKCRRWCVSESWRSRYFSNLCISSAGV